MGLKWRPWQGHSGRRWATIVLCAPRRSRSPSIAVTCSGVCCSGGRCSAALAVRQSKQPPRGCASASAHPRTRAHCVPSLTRDAASCNFVCRVRELTRKAQARTVLDTATDREWVCATDRTTILLLPTYTAIYGNDTTRVVGEVTTVLCHSIATTMALDVHYELDHSTAS